MLCECSSCSLRNEYKGRSMDCVCDLAGLGDVDVNALRALPLEASSSRCAAVYPGNHY